MTHFQEMLRRRQSDAMRTSIVITRSDSSEVPVFDSGTGLEVYDAPEPVYEGQALVRPSPRDFRQISAGGEAVTLLLYDVVIPADAETPRLGDVVTVTESFDSVLVGLQLVVRDVPTDEWLVNRRIVCEQTNQRSSD